jgi:hypothetical protein
VATLIVAASQDEVIARRDIDEEFVVDMLLFVK